MPALSGIRAASPLNASNDSRLLFTAGTTETLNRALDDTPFDFETMDSGLQITVEYRQAGRSDDQLGLSVRIVNGGTILAASDAGGTFQTVNGNVLNTADTTTTPTFGFVNTTASKAVWDGAVVELNQNYSQNMGPDNARIEVDTILLVGTYTAAGTTFQISLGGSITPSGVHSHGGAIPAPYTKIYPDEDLAVGSWTPTPIWSRLDDEPTASASESDVVNNNGGVNLSDAFVVGLPDIVPDTLFGWRIRVRARAVSSSTSAIGFQALLCYKNNEFTLTGAPAASIVSDSSWHWYEFFANWRASSRNDLPADLLTNLGIWVRASGSLGPNIEIAAVQLLIPNLASIALGEPEWDDVVLNSHGRSGPYLIDGDYYALGYDTTQKRSWLFKSTNPSDGHNPVDWERFAPAGELPLNTAPVPTKDGPNDPGNAILSGLDIIVNQNDELAIVTTTYEAVSGNRLGLVVIDPTVGTYGTTRHFSLRSTIPPTQTSAQADTRLTEQTDTVDEYRIAMDASAAAIPLWWVITPGVAEPAITADPNQLFDLIAANGRQHVFYGKTNAVEVDGIRQRTVSASDVAETEPGADITSEDHGRLGAGTSYNNGTVWRVIAPFPQADGGGITAIVFDSADAPAEGQQVVTTRDAYKVGYERSVVAIPVNSLENTKTVVVWIDAAADAIYGAFRVDGETTWTEIGELVAGSAGRTRLSGGPVDNETLAILVDDGTGIEFYTLSVVAETVDFDVERATESNQGTDVEFATEQSFVVEQIAEPNLASDIALSTEQVFVVEQAVETNAASDVDIGVDIAIVIDEALEVDTATDPAFSTERAVSIDEAQEVDVAQDVVLAVESVFNAELATETNSATDVAFTVDAGVAAELATEVDVGFDVEFDAEVTVEPEFLTDQAIEANAAFDSELSVEPSFSIEQASVSETAFDVEFKVESGFVTELASVVDVADDVALSIEPSLSVEQGIETNVGSDVGLESEPVFTVEQAFETNTAFDVLFSILSEFNLDRAQEVNIANDVSFLVEPVFNVDQAFVEDVATDAVFATEQEFVAELGIETNQAEDVALSTEQELVIDQAQEVNAAFDIEMASVSEFNVIQASEVDSAQDIELNPEPVFEVESAIEVNVAQDALFGPEQIFFTDSAQEVDTANDVEFSTETAFFAEVATEENVGFDVAIEAVIPEVEFNVELAVETYLAIEPSLLVEPSLVIEVGVETNVAIDVTLELGVTGDIVIGTASLRWQVGLPKKVWVFDDPSI